MNVQIIVYKVDNQYKVEKLKNLKCTNYFYVFMFLGLIFIIATFSLQGKEVSAAKGNRYLQRCFKPLKF